MGALDGPADAPRALLFSIRGEATVDSLQLGDLTARDVPVIILDHPVLKALGNVLGSTIAGIDGVWDISLAEFGTIVLANVLGMLMGFMLGVLLRSSAAAIVGYFVYAFVLPVAFGTLAAFQEWFRDLQPWVDVNYATTRLFDSSMTTEYWQQLAVTTLVWLWIPLAIGLRAVLRAEVK